MNRKQQSTILGLSLAAGLLAGTGREAQAAGPGPVCGHLNTLTKCLYTDETSCENITSLLNYCYNVIWDAGCHDYTSAWGNCLDASAAEIAGCALWQGDEDLTSAIECTMVEY